MGEANTKSAPNTEIDEELQIPEVDQTSEASMISADLGDAALAEYFGQLKLCENDEQSLFKKRGLTSVTVAALQFRSNPRTNQKIIEQMAESRGWRALIAAGIALAADPTRKLSDRANMQFCGKGQAGKIPKAERKNPNHKVRWGWTEPIIIPNFDANGKLIGLRPHKGGAPAGTVAGGSPLYIPRAFEPPFSGLEKFVTVVITEGEFKAAALWQTVGVGTRQFVDENKRPLFDSEEYGICSLPGISYSKHADTRAMLDEWLRSVGCRQVIVAFDREEKGDPNLSGYQVDPEHRYDSLIYAFYLASDLTQKLRLRARVCLLPKEWMNVAGKADWDGALASMIHSQTPK